MPPSSSRRQYSGFATGFSAFAALAPLTSMRFIASDPTDVKLSYLVFQQMLRTAQNVMSTALGAANFLLNLYLEGTLTALPLEL